MKQTLPNFFIVGAPKAGTTSLYHYLCRHPDVFMSPIKEPNYFCYQDTRAQKLYHKEKGIGDWNKYVSLFQHNNGRKKAVGEASVAYLFYPQVPQRIHQKIPHARIIISLRNPVERALSHYFMEYKLGYVNVPLADVVFRRTRHRRSALWYQQYVELGLYYEQVKRYLETFPPEQVKIFIYEEWIADLHAGLRELYEFLKLNPDYFPDHNERHNTFSLPRNGLLRALYGQKVLRRMARLLMPEAAVLQIKKVILTSKQMPEVGDDVRDELMRIYRDDIGRLETLLQKNLSCWYAAQR